MRPAMQEPSRFEIEPLEPRVLLAADLVGAVQSLSLANPSLPGESGTATVRVTNQGDARTPVGATIAVNIYLSEDAILGGDELVAVGAMQGRLSTSESRDISVACNGSSHVAPPVRVQSLLWSIRVTPSPRGTRIIIGPRAQHSMSIGNSELSQIVAEPRR